jgi:hypothetical protein
MLRRHFKTWREWQPKPEAIKKAEQLEERALAASAMKDSIGGALTGTSIVIATVAAILGFGGKNFPPHVIDHLRISASAGVLSLGFAIYTLAGLPAMVNKHNLAHERGVNTRLVVQLWLFVVAAARLALGIWFVL